MSMLEVKNRAEPKNNNRKINHMYDTNSEFKSKITGKTV